MGEGGLVGCLLRPVDRVVVGCRGLLSGAAVHGCPKALLPTGNGSDASLQGRVDGQGAT